MIKDTKLLDKNEKPIKIGDLVKMTAIKDYRDKEGMAYSLKEVIQKEIREINGQIFLVDPKVDFDNTTICSTSEPIPLGNLIIDTCDHGDGYGYYRFKHKLKELEVL